MKKLLAILCVVAMAIGISACGSTSDNKAEKTSKDSFKVGICQLVQHPALDEATKGFRDTLGKKLKADGKTVKFDEQNDCKPICK